MDEDVCGLEERVVGGGCGDEGRVDGVSANRLRRRLHGNLVDKRGYDDCADGLGLVPRD